MRFLSPILRCCAKATANRMAQASPDVAVRKLNGGISSSAIFMIGQVSPHARLSATSISRATASELACEAGWGTRTSPQSEDARGPPVYHQRCAVRQPLSPEIMQYRGAFPHVAPQFGMCYGTAFFTGRLRGAPVLPVETKSPIAFQGLGAHRPRRCRAPGIASQETRRGR